MSNRNGFFYESSITYIIALIVFGLTVISLRLIPLTQVPLYVVSEAGRA
jgi:hypothetical protein